MGLKDMKSIKLKVAALLQAKAELRDNDDQLVANIWSTEIDYESMSGKEVLKAFSEGELTTPESITRVRRKLQEQYPQLRGENYVERHKEEKVVRDGIAKL